MDRMIQREYTNTQTGEKILMFESEDFEYVKPVKHYGDFFIVKSLILRGVPQEELNGDRKPSDKSKEIFKGAVLHWQKMLSEFKKIKVPENLIKLLSSKKKSEQESLLKGIALTPDVLMGLLIVAEQHGYTLSQYTSEFSQKGVDLSKMPLAYEVKGDGEVKIFGDTEMSAGQLKQAIEHRKVKVAKILDRGDEWHCFFATFRSLRGEETWQGEKQPHFHYISNAFGIPRTKVVEQIKSEQYKLGNLPHIKLEEYGKQPS
ncbi:MAG TPA: hypothetical protein VMH27_09080 [Puia sp.]|nr:hypothetical protein [Puia sp.]